MMASMRARASLCAALSVAKRSRSFVSSRIAVSQRSGVSARVGTERKQRAIAVETKSCSGSVARLRDALPKTSRAQGIAASRSRA